MSALRSFVQQRLDSTRELLGADPGLAEKPRNLIEALLVARDEDGTPLSDSEIFGNAIGALAAGEDTTANTMAWMIWFLVQRPDVQASLAQEMNQALGDAELWTDINMADRLRYVDALMSEALRLKPVAPLFFMATHRDTELNGLALPAGTDLILLPRIAALQDAQFADAGAFKPERWLQVEQTQFTLRPPMPFGSGPRMCPGRNLAQLEIRAVMSMLGRNFRVLHAEGPAPVGEQFLFSMMPSNLRVRFQAVTV